jgi:hypothetical protein
MHCPSCGQQQVSSDLRFCSRCGFPLALVAEVLSHGGTLPQLNLLQPTNKKILTRRNGLVFSFLWFLFFLLIMTPFFGILTDGAPITGIMAILGIFGGMFLAVSTFFFLDNTPKFNTLHQQSFAPQQQNVINFPTNLTNQNALPPQQSIPIDTYQAPNQNPLYAAGNWRSTTDLLNKDGSEKATQMLQDKEQ